MSCDCPAYLRQCLVTACVSRQTNVTLSKVQCNDADGSCLGVLLINKKERKERKKEISSSGSVIGGPGPGESSGCELMLTLV